MCSRGVLKLFATLLCAFVLSGCLRYTPSQSEIASDPENVILAQEAFFQFEQNQVERIRELISGRTSGGGAEAGSDYRVGPEDLLEFSVFDVEELNTSTRVRPSGFISLPLLGPIQVQGLTEAEVQEAVTTKLGEYVHSPQVNVFIAEYAAHRVSVIGEVAAPGMYSLKRNDYSLIELLSEAGGRNERASGRIILIPAPKGAKPDVRAAFASARAATTGERKQHGIEIYFDDLVGSVERAPVAIPLRPGDTIVVPEAGTVEIDGEVNKPGSYPLSSRMTLLGAIASAGGLTYAANVSAAEVIRELQAGKKAVLTVDLEKFASGEGQDVRLRDGDVIRVPSQGARFATRQLVEIINRAVNVGFSATP